jgi:hypothetical protein
VFGSPLYIASEYAGDDATKTPLTIALRALLLQPADDAQEFALLPLTVIKPVLE